jgi:hypothetical protein
MKPRRVLRTANQPQADFSINPCLDAETADIHDHGSSFLNLLFESCHPAIARLEIVFVEPDLKPVAAKDLS